MTDKTSRVAIVTGASRGIGAAIAERLVRGTASPSWCDCAAGAAPGRGAGAKNRGGGGGRALAAEGGCQ